MNRKILINCVRFERKKTSYVYCYLCTFNFGIYITYILGDFILSWVFITTKKYKIKKYVIKIKLKEHKSVSKKPKETFFNLRFKFYKFKSSVNWFMCNLFHQNYVLWNERKRTQEANLEDLLF